METYRNIRAHYLYICRGYWQGLTCANKRHAQQVLANLRLMRNAGMFDA